MKSNGHTKSQHPLKCSGRCLRPKPRPLLLSQCSGHTGPEKTTQSLSGNCLPPSQVQKQLWPGQFPVSAIPLQMSSTQNEKNPRRGSQLFRHLWRSNNSKMAGTTGTNATEKAQSSVDKRLPGVAHQLTSL